MTAPDDIPKNRASQYRSIPLSGGRLYLLRIPHPDTLLGLTEEQIIIVDLANQLEARNNRLSDEISRLRDVMASLADYANLCYSLDTQEHANHYRHIEMRLLEALQEAGHAL